MIITVGVLIGIIVVGFILNKKKVSQTYDEARSDSKRILEEARRDADRVVKSALNEAKEESRRRRRQFEEEAKKRKSELHKLEKKLRQREQTLDRKLSAAEEQEQQLEKIEKKLAQDEKKKLRTIAEYELEIEQTQKQLKRIANMSSEEAKRQLMISLEAEAKRNASSIIRKIEEDTQKEAKRKATEIISLTVQRLAGEYVGDACVTVVNLPSEDMKGRIIGREGRNIRTLEQATGVDLIIDDTPEAVILSCFNPLRREIAKITLERLIGDGRIHPARIEETVGRVETEMDSILTEIGDQAAFDTGVTDLHPDLIKLLGKLKYCHTSGQTVLTHCVETSQICGMLASELGINVKRAKRAGLLHDIGKAADQEVEGHHSEIGADLAQRHGEHSEVIEAIRMHHAEDLLHASPLAVIVGAANTLSAGRPSARKEVLKGYIKRLEDMESIVQTFEGIESAVVLQAGREVRALVSPDGTHDQDVTDLSNDIAHKLRQELTFPGQVRITVLKESKHVEFAT